MGLSRLPFTPPTFAVVMAAGFLLPLLGMHGWRYGWFPVASDDAYIYLGYVKMLLQHGDLFSYNPGEHSAGTTGLLYYYLLSLAGIMALPFLETATLGEGLSLLSWCVNSALFLGMVLTVRRIWAHLAPAPLLESFSWLALLLAACALHPLFFWGWFGGLENPLTGLLVLLLLERALALAPPWQTTLLAVGLAGSRPELMPVAVLAALLLAWEQRGSPPWRSLLPVPVGFALGILLLILPCWWLTGTLFPSALGARVTLPPLSDPLAWWAGVVRMLTDVPYLTHPWVMGSALMLAAMIPARGHRHGRVLMVVALLMVLNFLMKGFLGLTHFNVHDRYISYLWPVYAIMGVYGLHRWAAWWRPGPRPPRVGAGMLAVGVAGWLAAPFLGYGELRRDVDEMNQVVVEPARWMSTHLPAHSRIAMEPAGAIRLFTPFYLVDRVGLTTQHLPDYVARAPNPHWEGFLRENRVTHVFDYPLQNPTLRDGRQYRPLKVWRPEPRRFSLGVIGLFEVRS